MEGFTSLVLPHHRPPSKEVSSGSQGRKLKEGNDAEEISIEKTYPPNLPVGKLVVGVFSWLMITVCEEGASSWWLVPPWAGGPGWYKKIGCARHEEQASKQHSPTASASFLAARFLVCLSFRPDPPSWGTLSCKLTSTLSSTSNFWSWCSSTTRETLRQERRWGRRSNKTDFCLKMS